MPDILNGGIDLVGGQILSLLGLSRRRAANAAEFAGATARQ